MYNDIVLDHFSDPRNVGTIPDADGTGSSGNASDGDKIIIYIKVKDSTLIDVKCKVFGCAAAIAAGSMVTLLSIGKTLTEALEITNDDVAQALGGLPEKKLLCSNVAATALHIAISDYIENFQK
ncbi:MAG: iron-sulfur cluster assembly scaffold protein [Clostridia bacterium]